MMDRTQHVVYEIRVSLPRTEPLVWRLIQTPSFTTLWKLHRILQVVIGWEDNHMHEFIIEGVCYGEDDPEHADFHQVDEKIVMLRDAIGARKAEFMYRYDFGDNWKHLLVVERIFPYEDDSQYPVCIAGEGACPPEDCGGIDGFQRLVKRYKASMRKKSSVTVKRRSKTFDPNVFELETVNQKLRMW